MNKWDKRFLNLAEHVAGWSKDPSTKCGAVIYDGNQEISLGYNGFPSGVSDSPEHYKNIIVKYEKVIHAEINAILRARRDIRGFSMAVYPFPPCAGCAAVIVQSGIKKIVTNKPTCELIVRWGESLKVCKDMFAETGVEVVYAEDNKL